MQIIVNKDECFPPYSPNATPVGRAIIIKQSSRTEREEQVERGRGKDASKVNEVNRKSNSLCFNQKFYRLASLNARKVIPIGERSALPTLPLSLSVCGLRSHTSLSHTLHSHTHCTPLAHAHALAASAPSTYLHAYAYALTRSLSLSVGCDEL